MLTIDTGGDPATMTEAGFPVRCTFIYALKFCYKHILMVEVLIACSSNEVHSMGYDGELPFLYIRTNATHTLMNAIN